jgi:hypothetical protein
MLRFTYAECHLCRVSLMLSVTYRPFVLSVVMLSVVMQSVVKLSVIMLRVIYAECHLC